MTTRLKRSQSLERSIRRLRAKVQATSRATQPWKWAHTHLLLADKYSERVQGQTRWSARQAQFHIRKAEQVFTRRQYPKEWAIVHAKYGHLISCYPWLGDVRRRLLAIQHEKLALQVFTRKADPIMWAELQQNISYDYGVLFRYRRQPEDLQRCYRHIHNALTIYRNMGYPHVPRKMTQLVKKNFIMVERQFKTASSILKSRYFKKLMENRRRPK